MIDQRSLHNKVRQIQQELAGAKDLVREKDSLNNPEIVLTKLARIDALLDGLVPPRINPTLNPELQAVIEDFVAGESAVVHDLCSSAAMDSLKKAGREVPDALIWNRMVSDQAPAIVRFFSVLSAAVVSEISNSESQSISTKTMGRLQLESWQTALGTDCQGGFRKVRPVLKRFDLIVADLSKGDSNPTYSLGEAGKRLAAWIKSPTD